MMFDSVHWTLLAEPHTPPKISANVARELTKLMIHSYQRSDLLVASLQQIGEDNRSGNTRARRTTRPQATQSRRIAF